MRIFRRSSPGTTLIEVVTVVMIISSVTVGLLGALNNFYYHYSQDAVVSDIREYGRAVMDLIVDEVSTAVNLYPPTSFNGFDRLQMVKQDPTSGQTYDMWIYVRASDGIVFDGDVPLDGALRLPNFGTGIGRKLRTVQIESFDVEKDEELLGNYQKLADSYLNIKLVISLTTKAASGGSSSSTTTTTEMLTFKRSIFVANTYI